MSDRRMEPHRGTLVLVMGILGLLVCVICGILAWVWGNADLKKMNAGTMDPEGRGTTNAGRILGMISCILAIVMIVIYIVAGAAFFGMSQTAG